MFKYGVMHGVLFTAIIFSISLLRTYLEIDGGVFEFIYIATLFIPLMVVGYLYKTKTRQSPLGLFALIRGRILFYPFGVAIFTTTLSSYGIFNDPNDKSTEFGIIMWLFFIGIGLFSHTLKIATAIWVGSWFKKINS